MKKMDSTELYQQVLKDSLYVRYYTKDVMYDFAKLNELEKTDKPFSCYIFYREHGTWMVVITEDSQVDLDAYISNSDFYTNITKGTYDSDLGGEAYYYQRKLCRK
jgi:hypothetical protein